jgi:hypothetical protein
VSEYLIGAVFMPNQWCDTWKSGQNIDCVVTPV